MNSIQIVIASSFNVGLIFYYWPYYKNINEETNKEQYAYNFNDHRGYTIKQLYVKQKHSTFKQEILSYDFITISEYYELVIFKAMQYFSTDKVRQTKAAKLRRSKLYYDILPNTPFSIQNLISLILYCNFTKLSTAFSATFRKCRSNESISAIKSRNQNYWFLSKILRETVELFGDKGGFDAAENNGTGPFYCGMSFLMVIPEFNIRLCSPTSTSMQLEVATKFGGRNGIIIQLNNNGGVAASDQLRSFNCNWISAFKEEDERLFYGGLWRIRVESVRVVKGWKNYQAFFNAMWQFDAMISGDYMGPPKINKATSTDKDIMTSLIEHKLKGKINMNEEFDQYVLDTFDAYCYNKKTVILFLFKFGICWFKGLEKLLFHSLKKDADIDNKSKINLVNDKIFIIFKQLETVRINTEKEDYPFSLTALLSVWTSTGSRSKIVITARHRNKYSNGRSWIYEAFCSMKSKINEKKYKFELENIKNVYGEQCDCLSFAKLM